jgi:phytoene dehydrogenase-like protein
VRQAGHRAAGIQLSGLAAQDARDPQRSTMRPSAYSRRYTGDLVKWLAVRQPVGEDGEHLGELGRIAEVEAYLGQMFHARPAAGYADLRTPVCGVYQTGSATHGGGVTARLAYS